MPEPEHDIVYNMSFRFISIYLTLTLLYTGKSERASRVVEEAVKIALRISDKLSRSVALTFLVEALALVGKSKELEN